MCEGVVIAIIIAIFSLQNVSQPQYIQINYFFLICYCFQLSSGINTRASTSLIIPLIFFLGIISIFQLLSYIFVFFVTLYSACMSPLNCLVIFCYLHYILCPIGPIKGTLIPFIVQVQDLWLEITQTPTLLVLGIILNNLSNIWDICSGCNSVKSWSFLQYFCMLMFTKITL